MSQSFITRGVPELTKAEHVSVLLTENTGPYLAVTRDGNTECYKISKKVAAELIAVGCPYGN